CHLDRNRRLADEYVAGYIRDRFHRAGDIAGDLGLEFAEDALGFGDDLALLHRVAHLKLEHCGGVLWLDPQLLTELQGLQDAWQQCTSYGSVRLNWLAHLHQNLAFDRQATSSPDDDVAADGQSGRVCACQSPFSPP